MKISLKKRSGSRGFGKSDPDLDTFCPDLEHPDPEQCFDGPKIQ
jgi:hypothetical protein